MLNNIQNLKDAIRIFVKSMVLVMKFNICRFGSHNDLIWERSRTYDQSPVEEAMSYIDTFDDDYGGTAMY